MRYIFKNTAHAAISSNLLTETVQYKTSTSGPLSTGLIQCKLSQYFSSNSLHRWPRPTLWDSCSLRICPPTQARCLSRACHPCRVPSGFISDLHESYLRGPVSSLTLWSLNRAGTEGDIGRQGAGFSSCLCAERLGRSSALLASATFPYSRGKDNFQLSGYSDYVSLWKLLGC